MEGKWSAEKIIPKISNTNFKTIEGAILHKQALVTQFETNFGFNRDMDKPDGNYAFNLGMLDAFKEAKEKEDGGSEEE